MARLKKNHGRYSSPHDMRLGDIAVIRVSDSLQNWKGVYILRTKSSFISLGKEGDKNWDSKWRGHGWLHSSLKKIRVEILREGSLELEI